MTRGQTPASAAGEWMGKIADLFSSADKNLDQVKKSVQADLEKLKRSTDTGASLYVTALAGFKKDLEEVGVSGDKQNEFVALFKQEWDKMEMGKKSSEILGSPELAAMDAFISSMQNLPKLKAIIDSAEPQSGLQNFLSGIAGKVPGLDQFMKGGGFDTILSALGLGFLVKKKDEKDQPKKAGADSADKPQDPQAKDKPAEDKKEPEKKEVRGKPKSTLFVGDSHTAGMVYTCEKAKENPLKIDGLIKTIASGGKDTNWGIGEIQKLITPNNPKPFKDYENAVVLFGTNDIGLDSPENTPEKIFGRLNKLYEVLHNAGVKRIYAVTVPPYGGYELYDRRPNLKAKKKRLNDLILGKDPQYPISSYVHRVIDTCKKESEGGLADNNNPDRFSRSANGDWLHPNKLALARLYQNELELGSAEKPA